MTAHGLVIGKFYPPHAGHHLVVRTAAACCDRVTVLVLAHPLESLSLEQRVAWLRDEHRGDRGVEVHGVVDDVPVDYHDEAIWEQHVALMRTGVAAVTDEPVTAVFGSEPYLRELARRLGAVAVPVDAERTLVPVSGTEIRADPVRHWGHLGAAARGWFARRVVVLGAESTGTTTVSLALTDALRARGGAHGSTGWVPEHGRDFTVDKLARDRAHAVLAGRPAPAMDELVWRTDEFVAIAARQNDLEDAAARVGGPVLVCDTDAFATGVWHERYQGAASPSVDALARHHPLYLLTHHDGVPFEQDGIRDGEAIRAWMTERFLDVLAASGRRCVVLRGPLEQRIADGLAAVDALLDDGWGLADPIGPPNGSSSR